MRVLTQIPTENFVSITLRLYSHKLLFNIIWSMAVWLLGPILVETSTVACKLYEITYNNNALPFVY
jgi:hypothetical protein